MARTMPPLAVPSSLVRTMPVTLAASVKRRACCRPFRPIFSAGEVGGELAGRGGFASAVYADHHDHFRWCGWVLDGTGYSVKDLLEFGFEELLEFVAALDAGAEGALAEVLHDDGRGRGAEVCGEEQGLEVDQSGFVDFAGKRDDGADGFGE